MFQCLKQFHIRGSVYAEGLPDSILGVADNLDWIGASPSIPDLTTV
jgi:hypothetical protein